MEGMEMEDFEERLRRVEAAVRHFVNNTMIDSDGVSPDIVEEMRGLLDGAVTAEGIAFARSYAASQRAKKDQRCVGLTTPRHSGG